MPLGERIGFRFLQCPAELVDRTLGDSAVGERTGLTVVGIEQEERLLTDPDADTRLEEGSVLLAIGSDEQVRAFQELFG